MCIAELSVARIRLHLLFLVTATAGLISIGCGGSTTTSVSAPSPTATRCQPAFDSSPRSFGPAGGTTRNLRDRRQGMSVVSLVGSCLACRHLGIAGTGRRHGQRKDRSQSRSGRAQWRVAHSRHPRRGGSARRSVPFRGHRAGADARRDRGSCAAPSPHACGVRVVDRIGSAVGQPVSWLRPGYRDRQPDGWREYRRGPLRRRRCGRSARVADAGCRASAISGTRAPSASCTSSTRAAPAAPAASAGR